MSDFTPAQNITCRLCHAPLTVPKGDGLTCPCGEAYMGPWNGLTPPVPPPTP